MFGLSAAPRELARSAHSAAFKTRDEALAWLVKN